MQTVARVAGFAGSCHTKNSCGLASRWLSLLLEMDLTNQTTGREIAGKQRNPSLDLPQGCRESDLGSPEDSRRTDEAWLPSLGADRLTMAPAGSQETGSV